jgi:hypothetical protein
MTALALISALGTALCVGYHLGRRAGSKPSTWKKRTSRVALGRLAINLLALMTARRIRQRFQAGRVFSDAGGIWGLRFIETLVLLRGSVARLRSYQGGPSSVDAINTFAVSAGHFASFGVVSRSQVLRSAAQGHFWGGFDSRQLHKKRWSIARLYSRDSCGSVGSAKALEIHLASGKQIVNAALEVT